MDTSQSRLQRHSIAAALLRPPPLVVAFGVGGVIVFGAAFASFLFGWDFALLKVGEENNIPTWFSASQLFVIGLVLAIIPYRDLSARRPKTYMLVVPAAFFFFLSLDEIAMIHERLGVWLQEYSVGVGLRTTPWMVIFVPLVGIAVIASA